VVSPPEQIEELIKQYYGTDTTSMEEVLKQLGEAGEALQLRETDGEAAVEAEANATPIIRLSISFFIRRSRTARATFISSRSKTNSKSAIASMARFTKCRRRRGILRCR
jgi:hypothetical protein